MGYALWSSGKSEEAAAAFEKALELAPDNAYTMYFLGRIADSQGRINRAIGLYESAIASGNPVYDTYQQVGKGYLRQGQDQKALEATQLALQQKPLDGALHYQLGRIYLRLNRRTEAQDKFETAQRLKAADQEAIRNLLALKLAIEDERNFEVKRLREQLLAESRQDPEILLQLGSALGKGGFHEEALRPLQMAVAMLPSAFDGQSNLGLALLSVGRHEEAEKHLKKALSLRPSSFEANSSLAFLFVNQGRNGEAIERLRVANDTRPNNARVLALLGQQYLQGRYLKEAIETLLIARSVNPNDSRIQYFLIEAYQEDSQFSKALEIAHEAVRADPSDARAHLLVGQQLARLGQCRQAQATLEQAIRLSPASPAAHNALADCLAEGGEHDAALARYETARGIAVGDLHAFRGIARSLIQLGRYREALAELERFLQTAPGGDAQIYSELARVHARMGDPVQAERARLRSEELKGQELEAQRKRTFDARIPLSSRQ